MKIKRQSFSKFSQLIRVNLNTVMFLLLSLNSELDYLKNYTDIENERINNRVNVSFNISNDIDIYLTQIPPMIIQPLMRMFLFMHFLQELILLN